MSKVAFTICSNNFLSYALSWADSLAKRHSEYKIVIGLADQRSEHINYSRLFPHTLIPVDEISISNLDWMTANYSIVEFNTAVKPFYFEYLFKKYNADHIFFFDPDIFVFGSINDLIVRFDDNDVLLTPHVNSPIPEGVYPWEDHFLNHGLYNLGFIGLKNTPNVMALLRWWQERCAEHCFSDYRRGLYVDQLWANFIPLFFSKVLVDRYPGYNVAFWNLHERELSVKDEEFHVNGEPLVFFHFSAFNPTTPELLTKEAHTNLSYKDNPFIKQLMALYRDALMSNEYSFFSQQPFAFKDRKKEIELEALKAEIARKEELLDFLKFRLINRKRLTSFMFSLFKDYIAHTNLRVGSVNDDRYNNLDFSYRASQEQCSHRNVKTSFGRKVKLLASSVKAFLK